MNIEFNYIVIEFNYIIIELNHILHYIIRWKPTCLKPNGHRKACYTDGNGPDVFENCSPKWIRNMDLGKEYNGEKLP